MTNHGRRRAVTALSLFLATIGLVFSANRAAAQSGLQYAIITDAYGNLIGQLSGNGVSVDATVASSYDVTVNTYTAPPSGVTMSTLAPAVTATPTAVKVVVPSTAMVGFCASGTYYDKHTGLCADGKFPYKIVQVSALSNPAAQVPNVACAAPRVATFFQGAGKWSCLVPPGYKLSM